MTKSAGENLILSVVVPVYSETENLENLRSWLKSSDLSHLQVILVVDSPREKFSREVSALEIYAGSPNVEIHHVNFGSPGETRNLGIGCAKSEWIAFWDCDDLPVVDEFVRMVQSASGAGASACLGSFEVHGINNVKQNDLRPGKRTSRNFYLQLAINPGIWRFAFKRSLISGLKFPSFRMGEDQAFLAQVLNKQDLPLQHKAVVYKYILGNPNQLTKNYSAISELTDSLAYLRELRSAGIQNEIIIPMYLIQSRSLAGRSTKLHRLRIGFSALKFMNYRIDILTLLILYFLREKMLCALRGNK